MTTRTYIGTERLRTYIPMISEGLSDKGRVRTINEDAYLARDALALWVVADGMGGHSAGDFASQTVIDCLNSFRPWTNARSLKLDIVARIEDANRTIRHEASARGGVTIGSTVVCMVALDDRGLITWAGDSRAYRIRNHSIEQLTKDHSVVQELVDAGVLEKEKAEDHPHAHVLTKAVGSEENLELEHVPFRIERNDRYILCSDGLSRYVTDAEILSIVSDMPILRNACTMLCNLANERGGTDNVTVVIVGCGLTGSAANFPPER